MTLFHDHIRAHLGYSPESICPGRIVRFATSERKGDCSGWAKLFLDEKGGVYGDHRSKESGYWFADRQRPFDAVSIARRREQVALAREQERTERRARWRNAAHMHAYVWGRSTEIRPGDPVDRYLKARGLGMPSYPAALRFHGALEYRDDTSPERVTYPGMVAQVHSPSGALVTLHRTYLTDDGRKAPVQSPRKLMPVAGRMEGAHIKLDVPKKIQGAVWLGAAEGIETALAASSIFEVPTIATISAGGMETFVVPDGVDDFVVFADNDASGTGISSAVRLGGRVASQGVRTRISMPPVVGSDWADVWLETAGACE